MPTWRVMREKERGPELAALLHCLRQRRRCCGQGQLPVDLATRRLTYVEGARKELERQQALEETLLDVIDVLVEAIDKGPMSQRAVIAASHMGERRVKPALAFGVERGLIEVTKGARRANLFAVKNPCEECGTPVTGQNRRVHYECEPQKVSDCTRQKQRSQSHPLWPA